MANIAGVNIDLTSNVLTSKEREARKKGIKLGGLIYSAAYDADLPDTGAVVAAAQVKDFRLGVDQQTFNKFVIENVATKVASPSASGGVKLVTKLTDEQELSYASEGIAFVKLTTDAGLSAPNVLTSSSTDTVSLTTNSTEGVDVAYIDLPGLDNTKGISLTTAKKIGLKIDTNFFAFEAAGRELGTKSPYYPSNTLGNLKLSSKVVVAPLKLRESESTNSDGTVNPKGIWLDHDSSLKITTSGTTDQIGKLGVNIAPVGSTQLLRLNSLNQVSCTISTADFVISKDGMLTLNPFIWQKLAELEDKFKNGNIVYYGNQDTSTATN